MKSPIEVFRSYLVFYRLAQLEWVPYCKYQRKIKSLDCIIFYIFNKITPFAYIWNAPFEFTLNWGMRHSHFEYDPFLFHLHRTLPGRCQTLTSLLLKSLPQRRYPQTKALEMYNRILILQFIESRVRFYSKVNSFTYD